MRKTFIIAMAILGLAVFALGYCIYILFQLMKEADSLEEEIARKDEGEGVSNLTLHPDGTITEGGTSKAS